MIIKSHIRGGFRSAADYLKEQGKNELTRLVEISDPHAKNLDEAFRAMWAVAEGTKARKPLHHVSINPMKDERLTDKQVLRICERLEEKYGYAKGDHQRVIVEHIKDGRQHFHVMWNRVSTATGRPIYPYMHKKQSKIAAREMEIELGLKKPCSKKARFGFGMKAGAIFLKSPRAKTYTPAPHAITALRPMFGFLPLQGRLEPAEPYRPNYAAPMMKGNTSSMCAEQCADYIAACDGKITWKQYFQKWGSALNLSIS